MSAPVNLPPTESVRRDPGPDRGLARLVVTAGVSSGSKLLMSRARATVGRHHTNDLVLDDRQVSATHLELERRPEGRVIVRDLRTTNGTWLGGHRIYEIEVGPGALLRLGDTSVRVELDDRAEPEDRDAPTSFGPLIGQSPEMRELFAMVERLAKTELSVVIEGESGTGKDALALAIHDASPRRDGPFVVVDAASLPAHAAEWLLFGKEEAGTLERARGGTLFIDEVADLPREIHAPLLRALETRSFFRVGDGTPRTADFRLLCASTRDLRPEIEAQHFKEGLYFRIAEARAFLPPLRSRPSDIRALSEHFAATFSAEQKVSLTDDALRCLEERPWPGNVRELRNVLVRASALSPDGELSEADVMGEGFGLTRTAQTGEALDLAGTFADAKTRTIERFETAYLDALLRRCGGNISEASRQADVARNHLRSLLKKRGLYDPGPT